jgi:transposase
MVVRLLAEIFEVELSVGSVGRLRRAVSDAIAVPVAEAQVYGQQQQQVNVDETSFQQGNADGGNPKGTKGWLWVVVTPWVCYFQVLLSRSHVAAIEHRQVCWAHLKRDFTKIAQRSGVSRELGDALLKQHEHLFELWHRVGDGTRERTQFVVLKVELIRTSIHQLLSEASNYDIAKGEKTPGM